MPTLRQKLTGLFCNFSNWIGTPTDHSTHSTHHPSKFYGILPNLPVRSHYKIGCDFDSVACVRLQIRFWLPSGAADVVLLLRRLLSELHPGLVCVWNIFGIMRNPAAFTSFAILRVACAKLRPSRIFARQPTKACGHSCDGPLVVSRWGLEIT